MTAPKLRFKEFDDSWDLKKLDQIAEVNPKTKELPASFFYIDLESVSEGLLIQRKKIDINEAPSRAQRLANSNMRCDSLKSLMIINKLSKFL